MPGLNSGLRGMGMATCLESTTCVSFRRGMGRITSSSEGAGNASSMSCSGLRRGIRHRFVCHELVNDAFDARDELSFSFTQALYPLATLRLAEDNGNRTSRRLVGRR
jgi:hypothetical protein